MSKIFLSHSSANNDVAKQFQAWLSENGWDDIFLDLDPERGIAAGQRWKEALQQAAHRCEVVIALVSPEWLDSNWCKAETDAARLMGKPVIVALIGADHRKLPTDMMDEQWVDLVGDPHGYDRLKEGLRHLGLDPTSFALEEGRAPYPGFMALEEDDAAIFFGRDAQIVRGLDKLRLIARNGVERMLIILGASGSGKSSFMRAGLWPKLKRNDRDWLPLPTIRPERAVLSGKFGLAVSIEAIASEAAFAEKLKAQGLPITRGAILSFVSEKEDGLAQIFSALREAGRVPEVGDVPSPLPTLVLPIDQGEELFNEEGKQEAEAFVDILTRTLKADRGFMALVAMRSDSFPMLQADRLLADLPKETFNLDVMLEGSYRAIIEEPALRVTPEPLEIDPELTEALLGDVTGQDALPLLAFALRRLYDDYGADGDLTLEEYNKIGRLDGVISTVVAEAFEDGAVRGELPKKSNEQILLARQAFIPHLARVNAAGEFARRVATLEEIPPAAWPLVDRFADRRLLIKDRREIRGEETDVVEVAHEALLHKWKDLHDALTEEREFLVAKRQLRQDVEEFENAPAERKSGTVLTGNKLLRARKWLVERPEDLTKAERRFVKASVDQADAVSRRRSYVRAALMVTFAAAAVISAFLWWRAENAVQIAQSALEDAKKNISRNRALLAQREVRKGDEVSAMLIALEGLPDYEANNAEKKTWPRLDDVHQTLDHAWRARRESIVLRGHGRAVTSAQFSPSGKLIVTTSSDKTARIWNAETGARLHVLSGHTGTVKQANFNFDGTQLITASHDRTARIWDVPGGKLLHTLGGHESIVASAEFNAAGDRALTASWDGSVRIWDVRTGKLISKMDKHVGVVHSAKFDKSGARIVSCGDDGIGRVWNAATGQLLFELQGHSDRIHSAMFSDAGTHIVSASRDGTARLWDASSGEQIAVLAGNSKEEVFVAAFSKPGTHIATAARDNAARIWDPKTGRLLTVLSGHDEDVYGASFDRSGARLVTASWDNTARLWDVANGKLINVLRGHTDQVFGAWFNPAGNRIVTVSKDSTARIWRTKIQSHKAELFAFERPVTALAFHEDRGLIAAASENGQAAFRSISISGAPTRLDGHTGQISALRFDRSGDRIVTASADGTARVWDTETGGLIVELSGHTGAVHDSTFDSTGARIATASADNTAIIWDAKTGIKLATLRGHSNEVRSAVFDHDGGRIATASDDKTARIWDAETGSLLHTLSGHESEVTVAEFNAKDEQLVTGSWDRTARIWDVRSGQLLRSFEGHYTRVFSAEFNRLGTHVVTASGDGTALIWDATTGKQTSSLRGHAGRVLFAHFHPDGKQVLTGSEDATARVWDAATGNQLSTLLVPGKKTVVTAAKFVLLKNLAVTASRDGVVRAWRIFASTQDLVSHIKNEIPRCLTKNQRKAYNLTEPPPDWCQTMKKWPFHRSK